MIQSSVEMRLDYRSGSACFTDKTFLTRSGDVTIAFSSPDEDREAKFQRRVFQIRQNGGEGGAVSLSQGIPAVQPGVGRNMEQRTDATRWRVLSARAYLA
jgi:uncharacterized FAD-dependent dehydrogenase